MYEKMLLQNDDGKIKGIICRYDIIKSLYGDK